MSRLFVFVRIVLVGLSSFCGRNALCAPGDELFSDQTIRKFKIEIAEPELNKLRAENRAYVHAILAVGEQVFPDVAVRLKGQGSFRPLDDKPSFAVKLNEFVPNRNFCGLTKIMLNNS